MRGWITTGAVALALLGCGEQPRRDAGWRRVPTADGAAVPPGTDGGPPDRGTGEGYAADLAASDLPPPAPDAAPPPDSAPPPCGEGPQPGPGQTAWPVPSQPAVCQQFGNPIAYQSCGFHTGIDICAADGAKLLAIAGGKVVHVGYLWLKGSGVGRGPHAIVIQHSPGFYSTYSHNKSATVQVGDCVAAGQQIGEVGNLGYSLGPHLHFEILNNTSFTGDWQVPFASACSHYLDPLGFIAP